MLLGEQQFGKDDVTLEPASVLASTTVSSIVPSLPPNTIYEELAAPSSEYLFLVTTAEKLVCDVTLQNALKVVRSANKLGAFVVDEAHNVNDKRPAYMRLGDAFQIINAGTFGDDVERSHDARTLALSGTITDVQARNVADTLRMKNPEFARSPFDRKDLSMMRLELGHVRGRYPDIIEAAILDLTTQFSSARRSILFVDTVKDTSVAVKALNRAGIRASPFFRATNEEEAVALDAARDAWADHGQALVVTSIGVQGLSDPNVDLVVDCRWGCSPQMTYQALCRAARSGDRHGTVVHCAHPHLFNSLAWFSNCLQALASKRLCLLRCVYLALLKCAQGQR